MNASSMQRILTGAEYPFGSWNGMPMMEWDADDGAHGCWTMMMKHADPS